MTCKFHDQVCSVSCSFHQYLAKGNLYCCSQVLIFLLWTILVRFTIYQVKLAQPIWHFMTNLGWFSEYVGYSLKLKSSKKLVQSSSVRKRPEICAWINKRTLNGLEVSGKFTSNHWSITSFSFQTILLMLQIKATSNWRQPHFFICLI